MEKWNFGIRETYEKVFSELRSVHQRFKGCVVVDSWFWTWKWPKIVLIVNYHSSRKVRPVKGVRGIRASNTGTQELRILVVRLVRNSESRTSWLNTLILSSGSGEMILEFDLPLVV
jgi:hypothetical protein